MPKVVKLTEQPKGVSVSEFSRKETETRAEKGEVESFLKSERLKYILKRGARLAKEKNKRQDECQAA